MTVTITPRNPPPLSELAPIIERALSQNFTHASASVTPCPDLRNAPFGLAARGLCGAPRIADVGGQPNLFPTPNFDAKFDLLALARDMQMDPAKGFVLGAGAAPFQDIGHNAELAPNLAWRGQGLSPDLSDGDSLHVTNGTRVVEVLQSNSTFGEAIKCRPSPSTNCALMVNLFGSSGDPGLVLKVTARTRTGVENFTNTIRAGLLQAYGDSRPVSLGGVFLLKSGRAKFHVMPDFPPAEELPFKDRKLLEQEWLRYQTCEAPVVCLTVFHSADPENLGLRMEHTHCFDLEGDEKGGHYHYDVEGEDVEYEAYLNVAQSVYRINRPG
ncbi:hypothetical protein ASPVEDRAFT_46607 [Aspergillus versicolor CBS 583.65]|uniref:DUF1907 domain-containing protein n=1 Tax=Aspergillus versicolor CBS 583.65 TaxID=1036611 RepID=A0A1L9Q0F5_ASPVE|nr:uncharacterized protein ASPVEDRAFT_46607 [Aspergillus versicolor CBS 583.65]OJJ07257.1 hypothetical protein ASPVEDRAFT_46607 [Aspergillus versicolor CBS 583.65]